MYQNQVLFPEISNRETWLQIIQISDDDTGDLIALTDVNNNPLYSFYCEISPPRRSGYYNGSYPSSQWYDDCGDVIVTAMLGTYITIVDVGTIQIQIPYTVIQSLRGGRTYNVYLRIEDIPNSDARQILIGRLPIAFGGLGT